MNEVTKAVKDTIKVIDKAIDDNYSTRISLINKAVQTYIPWAQDMSSGTQVMLLCDHLDDTDDEDLRGQLDYIRALFEENKRLMNLKNDLMDDRRRGYRSI